MSPRPPERKEWFFERLQREVAAGAREVRFGIHHHSHAVCREGERWSLRRLVLDQREADAFRAAHGRFLPEDAEALTKPGGDPLLEATSMAELIAKLDKGWPL